VLQIDATKLTSEVKFEAAAPVGETAAMGAGDAKPPLFPHLYGAIDRDAVVAELDVRRANDGTFLEVCGLP